MPLCFLIVDQILIKSGSAFTRQIWASVFMYGLQSECNFSFVLVVAKDSICFSGQFCLLGQF